MDAAAKSILVALTHRVRVLSDRAIGELVKLGGEDLDELLGDLAGRGLIERSELLARPELPLASPELAWRAGDDSEPPLGRIAYRLKNRWTKPPVPTAVATATDSAIKRFGGFGGAYRPRADDVTHDLHVGRVWMRYRSDLGGGLQWIGEDRLKAEGKRVGGRIPDAIVARTSDGGTAEVVEFGGSYAKTKLVAIHRAFRDAPYSLW